MTAQRPGKKGETAPPPEIRRRNIVGIVEDDAALVRTLARHLKREGYDVSHFHTAEDTMEDVLEKKVDVLLLDLMLPRCDGIELTRLVRKVSHLPILIITGRDSVETRVAGLDAGADDYLTKPFDLRELSARLRSILRRDSPASGDDEPKPTSWKFGSTRLLMLGRLLMDAESRSVRLTEREFAIFVQLLERVGKPVSRGELLIHATGRDWAPTDRRIDVHVAGIRKKLAALGERGLTVRGVRNVGYVAEGVAERILPKEPAEPGEPGVGAE